MASSVSQERLLERKPQGPVGQFGEVKAVPHDIISPFSGNSTVSWRALRILGCRLYPRNTN